MNEVPDDVEIETIWVVDVPYTPEARDRRSPLRRAHLTRIARLIREGRIVEAGGTADMTKAVLLIRAESEADALALIEDDVYNRAASGTPPSPERTVGSSRARRPRGRLPRIAIPRPESR